MTPMDIESQDWHGWRVGDVTYNVGHYPTRKGVVLYRSRGIESEPVAYFRSEEQARDFLGWLDKLAHTSHLGVPL